VPIFLSTQPLIAKIRAPHRGDQAHVSLSTGSTRSSESFSTSTASETSFIAFSVPWPGSNEFRVAYDDRSAVRFETREAQSLADVRRALAAVPRLRVMIGEKVVEAWDQAFEIAIPARLKEVPKITILPELEGLRVSIRWEGPEGQGAEDSLSVEIATRRLNAFFDLRRGSAVRVEGGGLGSIKLVFRAAQRIEPVTSEALKRSARWLGAAIHAGENGDPLPAWAIRNAARLSQYIGHAATKRSDPRFTALLLRAIKQVEVK
jgi:hypothetical protein